MNFADSSAEGLFKTLRHQAIAPLQTMLRDGPASGSDSIPCVDELVAVFECEGMDKMTECLLEILLDVSSFIFFYSVL